MLKRTIGLGLLCMASHAYSANIIVNTTDDEDGVNNDKCSLREAIELINRTDGNGKIPEAGYAGCSGKDASPSIVLETGKTYFLDKDIAITRSLSINVLTEAGNSTNYNGENNAVIQAKGAHRIFTIDDKNPNTANLSVIISQVDLVGCAAQNPKAVCASSGGLIFNHEDLQLSFLRLKNGTASSNGGAIYNEGIASAGGNTTAGYLNLNNVLFQDNEAAEGAAIYSIQPRYEISGSVFRNNRVTGGAGDGAGAIVFVNRASEPASTTSVSSIARTGNIRNSTFFDNTGWATFLKDGMLINNSTIIRNTAGIYLNAPNSSANLANSIVAENGANDCLMSSADKAITNNILYRTGNCGPGATDNPNHQLDSSVALLANTGLNGKLEGKCDQPPAKGLLCPFSTEKEIFNGFFKPRLLAEYESITDSPVVNRGRIGLNNNTTSQSCEGTDQRGKPRNSSTLCDIGSIELAIADQGKIGQDIKYNQIAQIDLTDYLGDGQLWPKALCDKVFKDLANPPMKTDWQDGCLQFVDGKAAKKGSLLLDENALLKYTPFKNFHGSDDFSIKVVTTTSRFSEGVNDRSIILRGTVVQEPEDNFQNKKVNTSGGSTGVAGLLGMLGLIWMRRRFQGVK